MIQVEKGTDEDKMLLKFTNGDVARFKEVMKKYEFVDEQALIRFALSVLLVTEDKTIKIKQNGNIINVEPAEHSVKKGED